LTLMLLLSSAFQETDLGSLESLLSGTKDLTMWFQNLGQLSQSSSASSQGINCWCNLLLILQMEYHCPGVVPLLVLMWVWAFNMCL
jgi:hypothetical protein